MNYTDTEVNAARATRDEVIKQNIPELKSIYMAGEIVMWAEIQERNKENPPAVFDTKYDAGTIKFTVAKSGNYQVNGQACYLEAGESKTIHITLIK